MHRVFEQFVAGTILPHHANEFDGLSQPRQILGHIARRATIRDADARRVRGAELEWRSDSRRPMISWEEEPRRRRGESEGMLCFKFYFEGLYFFFHRDLLSLFILNLILSSQIFFNCSHNILNYFLVFPFSPICTLNSVSD